MSMQSRRSGPDHDGGRAAAWVAAVALVWGSALATQYIAARFGYQHRLGAWLYRAPARVQQILRIALALVTPAAVLALLRPTARWYSVPLALGAVSVYAVIAGPIYAPTGVYSWYGKYGGLSAYRASFLTAWLVIAGCVILVTVAAHRVWRARVQPAAPGRAPPGRRANPWWGDRAIRDSSPPRSLGSLPPAFRSR